VSTEARAKQLAFLPWRFFAAPFSLCHGKFWVQKLNVHAGTVVLNDFVFSPIVGYDLGVISSSVDVSIDARHSLRVPRLAYHLLVGRHDAVF
jgi:hypothetical protein